MLDSYKRDISYLRISVTDKCNLRCIYCMPEEGVPLRRHDEFLSMEDMVRIVSAAADIGIRKVRITGGEPLVKRGIVDLVRSIRSVRGIETLAMTTNGILLEEAAGDLKDAGLDGLNISLDTLDACRYREVTRLGDINRVLRGIDRACELDFMIKLNMVVLNDTTDDDIEGMRFFCKKKGIQLQLIHHYSLQEEKLDNYVFERPPQCLTCNRIRLTADGCLKPCLHSDIEVPVNMEHIRESLIQAIALKPERGSICRSRNMVEIGG